MPVFRSLRKQQMYPRTRATAEADRALDRKMHQTIKKVTHDIDTNFHFNTAISAVMELFNTLASVTDPQKDEMAGNANISQTIKTILVLLFPMVPHFCSEMWMIMNFPGRPEEQEWPSFDEETAREDLLTIVLQVNGKVRSRIQVDADIDEKALETRALEDDNVLRFINGKEPKKIIVIKKKLVNIVV